MLFILLDDDLAKVNEDIQKFYSNIFELINESALKLLTRVFQRFPKLLDIMIEIMNKYIIIVFILFMIKHFNIAKELSDDIVKMNFNYMYIDEKVFNYEDLIYKTVLSIKEGNELFDNYYDVKLFGYV